MKNILGLDLGTNSIGWAKISIDENGNAQPQIKLGSRIIPMSQDVLSKFDSGVTESQTAARTGFRGTRRLRERCLQRRERLLRVLHTLNFLPEHFDNAIGWNRNNNKTYGKFIDDTEPKIAWKRGEDGKMQFMFMDAFDEMLADFAQYQPALVAEGKKIPLDWTLYYLRDKATRQAITKEQLAWILLSFNQKRGYYQLRGEDEEVDNTKLEEYYELKVVKVEATDEKKGNDTWYNVYLENGWIYRRSSKTSLEDWTGKIKEFIVTTQLEANGNVKLDKEGNPRRSFRAPSADDWKLQKKRAEASIDSSGKTVGSYIYASLLNDPTNKVRGKLVRTVERKFYKKELVEILEKQAEFIPELKDKNLLEDCARELYARNIPHQDSLKKKDMTYLLIEDLLFYQRPLKSKKSLISNCPYEQYEYVDKATGEVKIQHIKVIAKSNPYFQEFRLWQFVQNLRLFEREGLDEKEVTSEYLKNEEDYVRLFHFLNDRKEISQDALMKDFLGLKKPKGKDSKYPLRWNYVEDKSYPCNETRNILLNAFRKAEIPSSLIDDKEVEYRLWHLLYSVEDRNELIGALKNYASTNALPDTFVEELKKVPSFKKEYGAYSEKAVKKLLSVMRMGSAWSAEAIPTSVNRIFTGELDEKIKIRMTKQGFNPQSVADCKGLPEWLACYAVYGRHSEAQDIVRWESPADLKSYINGFKQYSLRNPIVEQCVLETLRTVYDIWVECGHIDEIHLELGRSMKSTADQRKRMTERNTENENTNLRIKQLLFELKNDATIEDVRPYSPMQQDILRIYEEGALHELNKDDKDYDEIYKISRLASPSQKELIKYKLWLEQKYRSPYTGKAISLSKLFTPAYQIEHVIPQGRFRDDSLSNKVICEAEVNQLKTNMLGLEFIQKCGGQIVHCPSIGDVKVLTEQEYKAFVSDHYANNRTKAKKLMMDDIPEEFIQRQMNDSRYISKMIKGLLSNVVREQDEVDAISKNVIPCTGGITDRLKKDWGLNDVWNRIVSPRFERMNTLTESEDFGHWENKEGKRVFQTTMPLELQKGFSKKRIDHRHHAMDALVIALASRNVISYLNNESARDTQRREDLRQLLCDKNRIIRKPWETFTQDAYSALQDIVVSFKHYVRVINKASNYYEHYNEEGKKVLVPQKSNEQWAVRKPMHKETVFGLVNLKRTKEVALNKALEQVYNIVDKDLKKKIQTLMAEGMDKKNIIAYFKSADNQFNGKSVAKVVVYYFTNDTVEPMVATRKSLDDTFDAKRIKSITDTGIQKILLAYLESKDNDPKVAFSPEGIVDMNEHIELYNGGKKHQPIVKVRVSEPKGEKYTIGETGCNNKKFVEAQSGTNLFYAIYLDKEGNRNYNTISFNIVAERLKLGYSPVPETNENGDTLKFYLSPNDLVYVPNEEERVSEIIKIDRERIYKLVSTTGNRSFFIKNTIASVIVNKVEFYSLNKIEKTLEGESIKAVCWKLEVDRLGNITKIIR